MRTTGQDNARKGKGQDASVESSMWKQFNHLLNQWMGAFKQERTWERATQVLVGLVACPGRSTLTNSILFRGNGQKEWSADYKIFSRAIWKVGELFHSVLSAGVGALSVGSRVVIAMDDTSLPKTGTKIPQARYCHNPLAPKFLEKPIMWGIRMLHAALIIPNYVGHRPLAISVGFEPVPAAEKPKAKKGEEVSAAQWAAYEGRKKELSLTTKAVKMIEAIREHLDLDGHAVRKLLIVADGSFTNGSVVRHLPHDTDLIGRFRKDARLFAPLREKDGKRIYGEEIQTPFKYRHDADVPTQEAFLHYGGHLRTIRFKDVPGVYWKQGTKGKLMRMLIVLPIPYRVPGKSKRGYNQEAYLLTTDLTSPADELIQAYLDRWQIEVLHRELKNGIGVGQVQAWNEEANNRIHGAQVATYSMLCLASLHTFEGKRTDAFPELPRWRKGKPPSRPSQHDLITILRNDLLRHRWLTPPDKTKSRVPKGWVLSHRETYQAA